MAMLLCGSQFDRLYAQDSPKAHDNRERFQDGERHDVPEKIKIDVYANLYMSGNTSIGNMFEELIAGYHITDHSFVGAGFMHSGVKTQFYGGIINYSYMTAWDSSLQLVPNIEAGFLYGPFSGNSSRAKFILDMGVELRQWLGRRKSTFCAIGAKVLSVGEEISLWGGITFGMSF